MAKVSTSIMSALCLLMIYASIACAARRVPGPLEDPLELQLGRNMLQNDRAAEVDMMTGPSIATGSGDELGTPTGRGVGIQGTGRSGSTGGGIGTGGGGTLGAGGPGSSLSGFNSGGSGIAGSGIGDLGRARSGTNLDIPGCILDDSGNMAITSCMTAGKRRILRA